MGQPIPPDQYDTIVALIRCFPDGIAVGELRRRLKPAPGAAELAHCLQHLARKRRVEAIAGTAGAPNARYRAIPDSDQIPDQRPADSGPRGAADGDRSGPAAVPPAVSRPAQVQNPSRADPVSPPAQPQNAPQADPVSPPAQRADAPAPAPDAGPAFEDVVREVVRDVVLSLSPKPSAVALAQTQAAILHWNAALTATLLVHVEEELRRLTPEAASEFNVVPEQVRAWRAVYDPAGAPSEPGPAPASKQPPAKPEAHTVPAPSSPTTPVKPPARIPSRSQSEPAAERVPSRDEPAAGADASAPAGAAWRPLPGSKQDLSTSVANALGTSLAGVLSRALGDKITGKERLVLGSVIAAVLMSVYQPFLSSKWVPIGLLVVGLVAVGVYVVRRRIAQGSGGTAATPGAWLRSALARYRGRLAVGAVLVLGAGAGWIWYQRVVLRPSKAAISDYLTRSVAPLPVRIVGLNPAYGSPSSVGCPVTYQVVFESTEPLFQRVDAVAYLREHAAGELAAIEAASALLRGPGGARILAQTGPQSPFPPVLVSVRTPPGAVVTGGGSLVAWRQNGAWRFSGAAVALDRTALVGEPKPAGALVIDFPADVAQLSAQLAGQVAYAAKVQAAAAAVVAEAERNRQQQAGALAELLVPGTLFTGPIVDPMRGTQQRVIVEITAGTAQQLSAVLRNDGGWSDARAFTGSWTLAPAGDAAVVTLRTSRGDWIDGAGPLLEDRNDYALTLQVRADGAVTSMPGNTRLQRVAPANAAAVRDDVLRPLAAAISATAAGRVYRGTARSRSNGAAESLLLRFLGGPEPVPASASLQSSAAPDVSPALNASLESATVAGRARAFRGTIISNTYRVGDAPIRLRSEDRAHVPGMDNRSPLGLDTTNNSLVIALRADGTRLTGQDDWFTYEFTPAEPGASAPPPAVDPRSDGGTTGGTPLPIPANPPPPGPPPSEAGGDEQRVLPPYPASPGAYLLSAGHWMILPQNDGEVVKVKLGDAAGVGELAFFGIETVPAAPAGEVILLYVGRLAPLAAATLKQYPHLKTDPRVEVVPLQRESGAVRHATVAELARDFTGFGPLKVPVQLAQPADDVLQVRCTLRPDRYALACGRAYFELEVK